MHIFLILILSKLSNTLLLHIFTIRENALNTFLLYLLHINLQQAQKLIKTFFFPPSLLIQPIITSICK